MAEVNKLYLKIGTKAQYTANKGSLAEPAKTLALTPLASEFTSNTTAGKGQFGVSGTTITTLTGTVGANTANALKPTYLNAGTITALSNSSGGTAKPVYVDAGAIKPISATVGADTAGAEVPVYLNAGTITALTTTSGGTAKPVYLNAGKIAPISATVGQVGNTTTASKPVYLNAGTITVCANAIPVDQSSTTNTAFPVYFANDTTAGSIEKINFSTRFEYNPNVRKFTIMSAANTTDTFTFGIQQVASW